MIFALTQTAHKVAPLIHCFLYFNSISLDWCSPWNSHMDSYICYCEVRQQLNQQDCILTFTFNNASCVVLFTEFLSGQFKSNIFLIWKCVWYFHFNNYHAQSFCFMNKLQNENVLSLSLQMALVTSRQNPLGGMWTLPVDTTLQSFCSAPSWLLSCLYSTKLEESCRTETPQIGETLPAGSTFYNDDTDNLSLKRKELQAEALPALGTCQLFLSF